MTETPPPPPLDHGRLVNLLTAAKGLTLTNIIMIALLVAILIPVYIVYKALGDEQLLDRLMSTYEEIAIPQSGCILRHAQERGGPDIWGISSGFAFQGVDRWQVSVVLGAKPTDQEMNGYCESLKLIADRMLDRGDGGGDAPAVEQ